MKPGMKVIADFALGLMIIVVVGVRSFIGIHQLAYTNRMVTHTHDVVEKLEYILVASQGCGNQLTQLRPGWRGALPVAI